MSRAEAEGDVFRDVQVREERVVLKDHAKTAAFGRQGCDVVAIKFDLARIWFFKAGDHPECGCLATTGWTQQTKEFAALDIEGHFRDRRGLVEALGKIFERKQRHREKTKSEPGAVATGLKLNLE